MKKITRPMTPAEPVSAEDDLDAIRQAQVLTGDAVSFNGVKLRPMSIGTFAMMQQAGVSFLGGDSKSWVFDYATYIALHQDDSANRAEAIDALNSGAWKLFVYEWLDASGITLDVLQGFKAEIEKSIKRFGDTLSKVDSVSGAIPAGK